MREYKIERKLMGSHFTLAVVCAGAGEANEWLLAGVREVERIEQLLSEFLPESATSSINKLASNQWVSIDAEAYGLIKRSLDLSILTKGDFDITVSPLKKLYRFERVNFRLPCPSAIQLALVLVGYEKLMVDDSTCSVKFSVPGMAISFAAIGKGYAADWVIKRWKAMGLHSGYVSAGGDVRVLGTKVDGTSWTVAIADPHDLKTPLMTIPMKNGAVATSGDGVQHFFHKGTRYSHNLNPHTGLPLSGVASVTVFSPSAELSDALATAIYVKGIDRGLYFIDQLPYTHAIMVDMDHQVYFSKKLSYETSFSPNPAVPSTQ